MRSGAVARNNPPTLGFTLVELVASVIVFGVVMTAALSFLQVQSRGFGKGLDSMSSIQAARNALGTLERDIQTAGTNLVAGQPEIVFAGEDVLAFNSDYATRKRNDPLAVFFDPDLEERATSTWLKSRREILPHTSFSYPDTTYLTRAGLPGPAETLIFFFEEDRGTPRPDDFALYRQVNGEEPRLVARSLLQVGEQPFFRYLTEGPSGIDSLPPSVLPLAHEVRVHGGSSDTGRVSMVDGIRGVRVTLASTNGREGEEERISEISRIVRMPNVGLVGSDVCGGPPTLGTGLSASLGVTGTGETVVDLKWERSPEDGEGENDVVRYVIWRRPAGSGDWGTPYLSIPAGKERYIYRDADLVMGEAYQYAIAAQDCTPTLSAMAVARPITVPLK